MSFRSHGLPVAVAVAVALAVALAASGCSDKNGSTEPQTAREKQLRDAKAAGEFDDGSAKWGKWRYTGDRKDCFFVVGKRCFKTEQAACQVARCKVPQKCKTVGGGPATVSCSK